MGTQLSQLRSTLESVRLPLSSLNPDASEPLIGVNVDDLVGKVSRLCASDSAQLAMTYLGLIGDRVQQLAKQVHRAGIVCGIFDKLTCPQGLRQELKAPPYDSGIPLPWL